ncbi:hypothetical protein, partial [Aquabacterium parvum]|uniref:hypothetical protein n=1 Tax=Aquabacterium parvum TaxID=70584 RepID=UPI001F188576
RPIGELVQNLLGNGRQHRLGRLRFAWHTCSWSSCYAPNTKFLTGPRSTFTKGESFNTPAPVLAHAIGIPQPGSIESDNNSGAAAVTGVLKKGPPTFRTPNKQCITSRHYNA